MEKKIHFKELNQIKETVGTRVWTALYQQKPSEEEGSILKRNRWKIYTDIEMPICSYVLQSYDHNVLHLLWRVPI